MGFLPLDVARLLFSGAGSDEGEDLGPSQMLVPTLDYSEWDGRLSYAEEEMGMPMKSQWRPRDEI